MKTEVKRWWVIACGMVIFLFIGSVYAWSIFAEIFRAVFPAWTSTDLATTFTIIMSFFCLGNIGGGMLLKKSSPRVILLAAAFLIGAGFSGVSALQENTLLLLYLSYGVVGSFGVGLAYNTVISVVTQWFPGQVGMASGLLMMSFAFSTLVVGSGLAGLADLWGWRSAFVLLGLLNAAMAMLGALLLKVPQQERVGGQTERVQNENRQGGGMTAGEMLKSGSFQRFFLWSMMLLVSAYAVIGNAGQFILELDSHATLPATLSVMIISVANGLGRLFLGMAYDRLGQRRTMTINSFLVMIAAFLLIAAFQRISVPLAVLAFVFVGMAYGGIPPTTSAFTVDFFGTGNFSLKFGLVSMSVFIGAFGSTLAGLIKDGAGSYQNLFYILLALGGAACLLNFSISKPPGSTRKG